MKASLFSLPSIGSRAEIERGLAGLRPDLYQRMLAELSAQAQLADTLGYDSISFTEHHFHVEGFELSTNPVLLDLFVAMQTKSIRVGQLGIVLPAENPIRVAENIAMLDHMPGGRANAGFARGYQRRWVDVMAQQTHGIHGALPNQHDAIDHANRLAFEENFRLIKQCWTEEMLTYDGTFWKVPAGPTPWPLDTTAKWGQGRAGRDSDRGGRGAQADAEAAPALVPALRQLGAHGALLRPGRRDADPAAAPSVLRGHALPHLCRGRGQAQGARYRRAARRDHRRQRPGGDGAVEGFWPVLGPRLV